MAEHPTGEMLAGVAQSLLTGAPQCQLSEVMGSCRYLVPQSSLSSELVHEACTGHNERALLIVPYTTQDGETHRGMVWEAMRRGEKTQAVVPYLDPRTGLVFHVDQERQVSTTAQEPPSPEGAPDEMAKRFRDAVEQELDLYLAERYTCSEVAGVAVHAAAAAGRVDLRAAISSRRLRPRGYWVGTWTSQWRAIFSPGQNEEVQLDGSIEFTTHYSEDGNVHFRRALERQVRLGSAGDPQGFARQLVSAIRLLEDEVHSSTEEQCMAFGAGPLKSLRRALQRSSQRFDWKPLSHALLRDLKSNGREGLS